jgi:ABC-type Zn2+ transport system substrate-binding protein/surface adhesin
MNGLEVIPKKEVVLTETSPEPLSVADRLLLNTSALKALEQEEDEEQQEHEEEQQEEEHEEHEEEQEEQEDAEELEEFEYKGSTYYRDADNNVFMADEEGELVTTPVGVWSEVKKRIITKKSE